jgi:hypothetical protein
MMMQIKLELTVPMTSIQTFILQVRGRMLDNPYHNWHHVVDVTQV